MVGSWADWELTELGMERAENIGRKLSDELEGQAWKIYSSDLLRARQTAEPLARCLNLPVEYRAELREINFGIAVGKTKQWMRENGAPVRTVDDRSFPDAESRRDVWNRLSTFCDEIVRSADEKIILVTHGLALETWVGVWLKWDVNMLENSICHGSPGGVSFMHDSADGKRVLSRFNDLSYMKNAV